MSLRGGPRRTRIEAVVHDVQVRLDSLYRQLAAYRVPGGGFTLTNEPGMTRGELAEAFMQESLRLGKVAVLLQAEAAEEAA